MQLRALRGAITVDANESDAILSATEELVREVMERNALVHDDVISILFTATPDIVSEFPALALCGGQCEIAAVIDAAASGWGRG